MTIASIAQSDVVAVDEHASVQEAAQLMRERHVGALAVIRGDARAAQLVGVVTDRDLALQVVAEGRPADTPVGAVGSTAVCAVPNTASLAQAVEVMRDEGVRRLLLVDAEQHLRGIVTLDDLIAAYADQLGDLAGALERGIEHEVERSMEPGAGGDGDEAVRVRVPDVLASAWRRSMEA